MVDVLSATGSLLYTLLFYVLCEATPPLLRPEDRARDRSRGPVADDVRERYRRFLPIPRPYCNKDRFKVMTKFQNISMTRVALLREQMEAQGLGAYMVTNKDDHMDELIRPYDKQVGYLSGYGYERALAIVTKLNSVLFVYSVTDVDEDIPCNWQIRRLGSASVVAFLLRFVGEGSKIGFDPLKTYDNREYLFENIFTNDKFKFVPVDENLVDMIRNRSGEVEPKTSLLIHDVRYSGRTWQSKIKRVRNEMKLPDVDAVVLDFLDDIAWLFNLRGYDYAYTPTFLSFAIVGRKSIKLYIKDYEYKLTDVIMKHLNVSRDGKCKDPMSDYCVIVQEYTTFLSDLQKLNEHPEINLIWLDPESNLGIRSRVDEEKIHEELNPVRFMKCVKNEVEQAGMRKAHLRDAVTLIEFISKLEREVKAGVRWTELSASKELLKRRRRLPLNMGLAFESISAVGHHAAIIHYTPSKVNDQVITTNDVYLLDSGGQYLDGTVDVTRTFHFGKPRAEIIDVYTRVLMGLIDLASTIFIPGTYGRELAFVARRHLWKQGYNFWHGVGHGLGHFLNVHEDPVNLIMDTNFINTRYYEEGMFQTIEPGYYKPGDFGIRLETVVMVARAVNQSRQNIHGSDFFKFESISFFPFEPKMINFELLSPQQKSWLNEYNKQCREILGAELWNQGKKLAYDWLMSRTETLPIAAESKSATAMNNPDLFILAILLITYFIGVKSIENLVHNRCKY